MDITENDWTHVEAEHGHVSFLLDHRWTSAIVLLSAIAIFTRITSGLKSKSKIIAEHGAATVPAVPYWLPFLGHMPNMAINADGFVKGLRDIYNNGIFALNFTGTRHNVIHHPGLATAILNTSSSNANNDAVSKRFMNLVFGFPSNESDIYDAAFEEIHGLYKIIQTEPGLGNMADKTARKTKENINDLVTFMESPVDQMPWEKVSDIKLIERPDGARVVEASLLPLVRDFCAFTANYSIMGSDFLENNPQFFDDIWTLDQGFLLLATGLPRWAPIPVLTRAHIARRNNLRRLETFHTMMEKHWNGDNSDPKWSSLDDVGDLLKARMDLYRKYNLSMRARASAEHALMWASNANSNTLVFWLVNRIYEDKALLAMIREEIALYVKVEQLETGLPIKEPPRITSLDVEGLCDKCPLLKSCYIECLRLDTGPWSFKSVKQDFVLQSREKEAQGWLLRKGEYVHVAHDLHNTDPNHFENPSVWKADRHIKYDEKRVGTADMGSIRPYGGGNSMCKGRAFALKEIMMFTAAIVSMWDIEAAGGGKWKMPKHKKATAVYATPDDTRVWIKARDMPATG